MIYDPDSWAPSAVELAAALRLIESGALVATPDIDDAILDLPQPLCSSVLYATSRGYAGGEDDVTLTKQGRQLLAMLASNGHRA